MPTITELANPTRFMGLSARLLPWLWGAAAVLGAVGFYGAWALAPADYQQGETIRIMYIHVPSAWLAMAFYSMMTLSALGALVWKHPLAEVAQRAAAPIGAAFALICLITGALWGKPMWGTYWVWDARLTSMLVLFLMYLGLIALWRTIEDPGQAGRIVSILTLVGFVNIPIIKFSVDWWNTLHQPASVFRLDGPTIHPSMLWPLLICALAASVFAIALHLVAMRAEVMARRIRTLTILAADRADAGTVDQAQVDHKHAEAAR
jgi:heme exporter protein C